MTPLHPYYSNVESYRALRRSCCGPDPRLHFFEHYKDLESGKWVKVQRWGEAGEACKLIESAIRPKAESLSDWTPASPLPLPDHPLG